VGRAGRGGSPTVLLWEQGPLNSAPAAASPYPVSSVDRALKSPPQLTLDAAMAAGGRDRLREMPGLAEARWASVPGQALLHPGPALGKGLEQLFALGHPEAPR